MTEKIKTGGLLASSDKDFKCSIGDSLESIKEQNSHLSDSDVLRVFEITREQTEQTDEHRYSTEN